MAAAEAVSRRKAGSANRRVNFSRIAARLGISDRSELVAAVAEKVGVAPEFLTTMRDIYPGLPQPEPGAPDVYGETVTLAPGVGLRSPEGALWERYTWGRFREGRKGKLNTEDLGSIELRCAQEGVDDQFENHRSVERLLGGEYIVERGESWQKGVHFGDCYVRIPRGGLRKAVRQIEAAGGEVDIVDVVHSGRGLTDEESRWARKRFQVED